MPSDKVEARISRFWEGFMRKRRYHFVVGLLATVGLLAGSLCLLLSSAGRPSFAWAQENQVKPKGAQKKQNQNTQDGKNKTTGKPDPAEDPAYRKFGIYENTAPRAAQTTPVKTSLPLEIPAASRIALVGNTLLERSRLFGHFETLLQQRFPGHNLVVRNLAWSADTPDIQVRPANFADLDQHLTHEKIDIIFAAYGFNESFAGQAGLPAFRESLSAYIKVLQAKSFNGKTGPQIVLVSPIANENITGVPAADLNNNRIKAYLEAMRSVAKEQGVGFVDVFTDTAEAMGDPLSNLTLNGCHLNEQGHAIFAKSLYEGVFLETAPTVNERVRQVVTDKNQQYFRRYRPVNTFYYTGGRNKSYGYLDFLPAMQNFDIMVNNRNQQIWDLAAGKQPTAGSPISNDSNLPELPPTKESRGANQWMTAAAELKAFKIDDRFEVNLFAGEEEFPEIAAPIQMRWDSRGRLWVSCSTTYPHVYPGNEPNDKLVILEDTDGDGRADKSSVFADNLHIPLSFEFGDGGVYVSEMPHLTFIKDTDGDGKADFRQQLLTGFGTEDSHHALHDFTWTPGGDLIFRESIFHHSQVETPYGPVRQQNSGWFRFQPKSHRLTSFGTYHSTNPWGVTFDDWGQHVASHPVYAAAFHSLDPPYPQQHPKPAGLRAYSGTCGQEFVDFKSFPPELQGSYIKVRYKPTNRVEIHKWVESEFGYDEQYVSDLIFSTNLSFIPVDIRFGPRGALYVCDWYNPIKGHAQYSLRDPRRDRHSGRIWRITAKGGQLQEPPRIAGASIEELLELLKRSEYRYRYWAKRELRAQEPAAVKKALDHWVTQLGPQDPRFRHHQVEALWAYRNIDAVNTALLLEVIRCDNHHARAAATQQLRYWHPHLPNAIDLLRKAANDSNGIVRMEAAIAASYIGSREALDALLETYQHPNGNHLAYAMTCALGSHTMRRHWENNPQYDIARLLKQARQRGALKEPTPSASEAEFDLQKNLKNVTISCLPERMRYTVDRVAVTVGQPVKLIFKNPDATDHNLVIVKPGALEEVGMAANQMAKEPRFANSDFIPREKKKLILQATRMIGPTRRAQVQVLRFMAPSEPGIYPYVCTFPGHWVVMKGLLIVVEDLQDVPSMLASIKPTVVKEWKMSDFTQLNTDKDDEQAVMRGMQAYMKARCNQCHVVAGHGINLGPDLTDVVKRFKGAKLLQQMLEPSKEINEKYRPYQFVKADGRVVAGVIIKERAREYDVITNLLLPNAVTRVAKKDVDEKIASKISPMPVGMLNVLTRQEILNLMSFLEAGGYQLPDHLKKKHKHGQK
jgi:putative heme-binding domain-containing protein